jgi:AcrR family transcriptional regulator/DNA-binding MarR family transcriptional regulator
MSLGERASSVKTAPVQSEPAQNGWARERVSDIQRVRVLSAMVEVCAERGAAVVTVADVVARAGVSRRTFYELFDDREDCLLAALEDGIGRASRRVLDTCDLEGNWVERMRTGLTALLEFFDFEPGLGRLMVVGSLEAGSRALEYRRRSLAQAIAAIDEGREESGGKRLPPLTAEGVVGGVLSVLHSRLAEWTRRPLVELVGPLMGMIVLPYLGPVAAGRELKRRPPVQNDTDPRFQGDPLRELGMRLTYRTVRVLFSVGAHPGSSNREIGDAAGIGDQGQTSKLLSRLQRLGLVRNAEVAPGKGTANVWTLTERGEAIHAAIVVRA